MSRELRCYDYVNRPYPVVVDALRHDALGIFERATTAAVARAKTAGPELHARLGVFSIGVPISVRVAAIATTEAYGQAATRLTLEWKAAQHAHLFAAMAARLDVYALSSTETQLDFSGTYDPPLGWLGDLGDALVAHRIGEAAVHRFVEEISAYLRDQLVAA